MARRQSFADKASKKKHMVICQTCGGPVTPTMMVLPDVRPGGSIKYKKRIIGICKCNHKEYYG